MDGAKPWYQSTSVWGGLVSIGAGAAGAFGYTISPEDQAAIVNAASQTATLIMSASAMIGGAMAIIGRVRASKKIG